jgi:hypothetical protein
VSEIRINMSREGVWVTMDGTTTKDDPARFAEAMKRLEQSRSKEYRLDGSQRWQS